MDRVSYNFQRLKQDMNIDLSLLDCHDLIDHINQLDKIQQGLIVGTTLNISVVDLLVHDPQRYEDLFPALEGQLFILLPLTREDQDLMSLIRVSRQARRRGYSLQYLVDQILEEIAPNCTNISNLTIADVQTRDANKYIWLLTWNLWK